MNEERNYERGRFKFFFFFVIPCSQLTRRSIHSSSRYYYIKESLEKRSRSPSLPKPVLTGRLKKSRSLMRVVMMMMRKRKHQKQKKVTTSK